MHKSVNKWRNSGRTNHERKTGRKMIDWWQDNSENIHESKRQMGDIREVIQTVHREINEERKKQ